MPLDAAERGTIRAVSLAERIADDDRRMACTPTSWERVIDDDTDARARDTARTT